MSDYQITDEDIDGAMHYLQVFHPENANREFAATMLQYIKSGLHKVARDNPDNIESMHEAYENYLRHRETNQ